MGTDLHHFQSNRGGATWRNVEAKSTSLGNITDFALYGGRMLEGLIELAPTANSIQKEGTEISSDDRFDLAGAVYPDVPFYNWVLTFRRLLGQVDRIKAAISH